MVQWPLPFQTQPTFGSVKHDCGVCCTWPAGCPSLGARVVVKLVSSSSLPSSCPFCSGLKNLKRIQVKFSAWRGLPSLLELQVAVVLTRSKRCLLQDCRRRSCQALEATLTSKTENVSKKSSKLSISKLLFKYGLPKSRDHDRLVITDEILDGMMAFQSNV